MTWLLAAAAQAAIGGAPPAPAAGTPAPAPAAAKAKPDVTCHMEALVGTLVPKRICISRSAQDARGQGQREALEAVQRSRFQCNPTGVKC